MGSWGLSRISRQSLVLMRTANLLGSKAGRDTMASTSPDRGSSATTEPFLPSMANSATVCTSRSTVSCTSWPSTAFLVARVWRTCPRLSTTTWRCPSTLREILRARNRRRRELRGVLRDRESAVNTLLDLKRGGITEKEHAQQESGSAGESAKPQSAVPRLKRYRNE